MPDTTTRAAELTQYGDADLVEDIYKRVSAVLAIDDPLAQDLYFLLAEAFERFAPSVEAELSRRQIRHAEGEQWEEAFESYLIGRGDREVQRLRSRTERAAQREGEDA